VPCLITHSVQLNSIGCPQCQSVSTRQ
jgi:hypothetical protein